MRRLGRHRRSHLVVGDDAVLVLLALVDRLVDELRSAHIVAADLLPAAGVDAAALDVVAGDGGAAGGARRSPADLDEVLVGIDAVGTSGTARNVCGKTRRDGSGGVEARLARTERDFFQLVDPDPHPIRVRFRMSSGWRQVINPRMSHIINLTSRGLSGDRLVASQRLATTLHVLRHDTELVGCALQEARDRGVGVLGVDPAHGRDPSAAVVKVTLLDHIATAVEKKCDCDYTVYKITV